MRILVSNDDGIYAPGIRVLAERLAAEPSNSVFVVAPDRERSATGHALTLHKPIRVEKVDFGDDVKGAWWTTGTPADCVKFAVGALLKDPPDLVVSGINNGANLGTEVLYSGTVSAAMEGAILHIPSIAVSLVGRHNKHYAVAADFVAQLTNMLPEAQLPGRVLLNVNVPNVPLSEMKGVALTQLGVRVYNDYYEKRVDPRGKVYYWLAGEAVEEGEEENTDAWAVLHNQISVTPISFNMTDEHMLEKLANWTALKLTINSQSKPIAELGVNSATKSQTAHELPKGINLEAM
ncbi:MAG: 5'/3'-nucleotidase SurE [Candidatus Melainabacteria bacterium]|nr:5'/3'-nucleotidase SurE [Candidatus Melainabacteria bacterium]